MERRNGTMRRQSLGGLAALVGISLALLASGAAFAQEETDAELKEQLEALKRGQQQLQTELRLMREIEQLRKGQEEIRGELAEIKKLLQQQPAAAARAAAPPAAPAGPNVDGKVFDLGDNASKGSPGAALTLVEFTDYQCPYCGRHARDTAKRIEQEYVDTGKLRLVTVDLPLRIHPDAFRAAQATHCAQDQGKFWEMHDRLFENQTALEPLRGHAEALGLDADAFEACMTSEKYAAAVRADMVLAQSAGASGTPSFVLGRTDPNDPSKVTGVAFIRGAQPFEAFKAQIDKALSDADE
jgi:protein-disulfide isomerase